MRIFSHFPHSHLSLLPKFIAFCDRVLDRLK
jgi:hypothetical protein